VGHLKLDRQPALLAQVEQATAHEPVQVVDLLALRRTERDDDALGLLARSDDRSAQRHQPTADVEIDAKRRAVLDRLARRHEHGPIARIEDLDPLRMAAQPKLETNRAHVPIVLDFGGATGSTRATSSAYPRA